MRVRANVRRRWLAWIALGCFIGVFAGGVTAVAAGARRTDTAYPRFLAATRAPDLLVMNHVENPSLASFAPSAVARLPQVVQSGQLDAFVVLHPNDLQVLAPTDRVVGYRFYAKKILSGRLPDPHRPDEVAVSFRVAEAYHIGVGDVLPVGMQPASGHHPVTVSLHVVGVDAAAAEFPPEEGPATDTVWATPAFVRDYAQTLAVTPSTVARLAHGASDGPAVESELATLAHGKPFSSFLLATQGTNTERSIHFQSVALWALAGLLALAGLVIVAQMLARQDTFEAGDHTDLHALGMTSPQLWAVSMARVLLIGIVSAFVCAGVATALSPVFPLGLARIAEPHPGLSMDIVALTVGAFGTLLAVVVVGAGPAWRTAKYSSLARTAGPNGPSRRLFSSPRLAGAPVTASTGLTFALSPGRGSSAVPLRSTITAAVIGVAALTAAIVFSTSLAHLVSTPRLYGVTWDALVTSLDAEGSSSPVAALPAIRRDPDVVAISVGYAGVPMQLNGSPLQGVAFRTVQGRPLRPTSLQGGAATNPRQIVLGSRDLAHMHLHLGDKVHVSVAGLVDHTSVRVVGTAVFPYLADDVGLGRGADMTVGALKGIVRGGAPQPDTILVGFRTGHDRALQLSRLRQAIGPDAAISVASPQQPADLVNFGRVEDLPVVLGGLLVLLALGALAHMLITSVRVRRHELALLKVLGFLPRQVRSTVIWQAAATSAAALALGLPLGVVLGRVVWLAFANQLGVVAVPMVPLAGVAAIGIGGLVATYLIAVWPADRASRVRVAQALRTG